MTTAIATPPTGVPIPAGSTPGEICTPVLLLGAELRSSDEFGDHDTLRRRVHALLEQVQAQLRATGMAESEVQDVMFALVAFVDESVVRSTWDHKSQWLANPLQFVRFKRYDAGEEFFARLDRLRAERAPNVDVLEIYWLCLTLDFKGRYQLEPEDRWQALVDEVGAQLRRLDGGAAPTPLRAHTAEYLAEAAKEMPVWVLAVVLATLAFFLYAVLSLVLNDRLGDLTTLLGR